MDRVYIEGIDEPLPENEKLLWQGAPDTRVLARYAFRVRWIAAYFGGLAVLALVLGGGGTGPGRAVWLLLLGGLAVGLVTGWAWLVARSTVYALTDRRILMRVGVAFPSIFNLPLALVGDAWIRSNPDGSGDVALELDGTDRIGFAFLWPHVRPWRLRDPQPMLRGLAEVEPVGERIREAWAVARAAAPATPERKGVVYSVMDDDGIEILSNRRPSREPQNA